MNKSNKGSYSERIGLFFFFVACAGMSIIVWIFNWICWINRCCCCDFLHNPVNKRIVWWMSFTFLLGILSCCVSAFVSVNRFGFAIEGTWCSIDRIYYDTLYGQLSNNGKWEGIREKTIKCKNGDSNGDSENEDKEINFSTFKTFLDKIHSKLKYLNACQILSMIYFCLYLITVTSTGISMMFYACLKRQGYLITFMIVLWNIIRFFIFSFFLFGATYGILFLMFRDAMAIVYNVFEEKNGNVQGSGIDIKSEILDNSKMFFETCYDKSYDKSTTCDCYEFETESNSKLCNFYENCENYLKTDINLTYRVLNDASSESQKLCALSLCSAFFGEISVYFFLLVLHHYNNELFFDSGKSIFKGFNGFEGGYKKKILDKDPAYKKRKLRTEIELTSKNDDLTDFKVLNKNGNVEDD